MKQTIFIIAVGLLLSACSSGPSPEQIQGTVVAQVTSLAKAATPYPTYTLLPTYTAAPVKETTVEVTRLATSEVTRIVTQTPTPTPEFTETPTLLPAQISATEKVDSTNATATAQAEVDAVLKAPRQEGFWLVGVDIAPGLWRNDGIEDNCYWERSTKTGDIIDNHFGQGGGTSYIRQSDFQFQSRNCGTWTWLSQ